jgi:hypothetical protein
MLAVSVIVVALATCFIRLHQSTSGSFENARETVELPYP